MFTHRFLPVHIYIFIYGENKFIEELFGIDGVKSIFVGSNFVSITKKPQAVWGQLKAKILIFLVDYLNSHEIIFNEKKIQIENDDNNLIKDKTSKKIKDIIDAITNESTVTVSPRIFKRKVLDEQGVIAKAALMREGKWEWRKPILSKQIHSGRPQIAIDGNHRIAAAILAGIDQVPVIWVDHIINEVIEGKRTDIKIVRNSVIIRV